MYICRALFKYGYYKFYLSILEYCEPEKCLEREGYYFKLLNPEYNTAKKPGAPMSGRTHSEESKRIMSEVNKKSENPGRFKTGENNPNYGKSKVAGSGRPSQAIEVTDLQEKTTIIYDSIREAARVLGFPGHRSIVYSLNTGKAYKKRYTFKKL
jgi:hypothetical protein